MDTTGPAALRPAGQPSTPARILVVDDEAQIVEVLAATLAFAGFDVRSARSAAEARQVAAGHRPQVALLDVMLPDGSGFELCDALRENQPELGVLFVTARDAVADRLTGLALADGYITKPFSVAEVIARLHVLLRRTLPPAEAPLRVGDLELDERSHRVRRRGESLELTPTEFKVLAHLMGHPGLVVSKQQLLERVWGHQFGNATAVEKVVSQLRHKIGPGLLHTVRGFGYTVRDEAA